MLAPFWLKPRIGPYLRRERDKRNYFLLFGTGNAVGGLQRMVALLGARKIDIGPEWPSRPSIVGSTVLRFHNALEANDKKSFHQVIGHGAFLRDEMLAMTRRRFHPPETTGPFIAVHVRLGDFTPLAQNSSVVAGASNTRLPIEWYGDRLDALRNALGEEIRAVVFSDGTDAELASLLARTNTSRAPRQQSVTDLLEMGQGVAVIASGSGFSMWGAFLGSAPRLSYPGQSRVPIYDDRARDIESGIGETIPQTFIAYVQARNKN